MSSRACRLPRSSRGRSRSSCGHSSRLPADAWRTRSTSLGFELRLLAAAQRAGEHGRVLGATVDATLPFELDEAAGGEGRRVAGEAAHVLLGDDGVLVLA